MSGEVSLPTGDGENPLLADNPHTWDSLIEAVNPASILLVIETRMNPALKRRLTPEDIWQETLLHVWRDRAKCQWQGLRHFRAWILQIAENRIRDAVAREHAQKRGAGAGDVPLSTLSPRNPAADNTRTLPGPAGSTTPSRIAMYREQATAMQAALASLPDDLRDVVRLRLFEQRTISEIAQQLSLGESAVRYRFRQGAERYQRRLLTVFASRSADPRE